MSFSRSFLTESESESEDDDIAQAINLHLLTFIQTLTPGVEVGDELKLVKKSNLCYGMEAIWHYINSDRELDFKRGLRKHFLEFETRLLSITTFEVEKNDSKNAFVIFIEAQVLDGKIVKEINFGTEISIFDQQLELDS